MNKLYLVEEILRLKLVRFWAATHEHDRYLVCRENFTILSKASLRFNTMQILWLTQLVFVIFNIFLVFLFVVANRDFCGSVFETQVGK